MALSKKLTGTLLTGAFVVSMAASAAAYTSTTGSLRTLAADGVTYASGSFKFYVDETNDFYYTGTLKDTKADGHSVFVQGKVEAYAYEGRQYVSGGNGSSAVKSAFIAKSAIRFASQATVQTCVDRGTFGVDYCDSQTVYR